MKRFRFNKIKWDKILSSVLVIGILIGCTAGLAAIFNAQTTDISSVEFKKGALDSNGLYIESDTSIYTKSLIECQGLVIEPDFEATGTYQIFYYDTYKSFISSTEVFDAHTDGNYAKEDSVPEAKYCRIVISPEAPMDEDGYPVEDWKIYFWQVGSYANVYKISVNKVQSDFVVPYKGGNKLVYNRNASCNMGQGADTFMVTEMTTGTGYNISELVSTTDCEHICIAAEKDKLDDVILVYLAPTSYQGESTLRSLNGDIVKENGFVYITIDIPANCAGIFLMSDVDVDFSNFGIYAW